MKLTWNRLLQAAADNSPEILTAVGVVGTVTTAVLASKATIKSIRVIDAEAVADTPYYEALEPREAVELCWKFYIPTAVVGSVTISAIIASQRVSSRRAAAMATAFTISERAFSDYKEKVVHRLGEAEHRNIQEEIAQDRLDDDPVTSGEVLLVGRGDVLCYDKFTGRYFESSMEDLRSAENEINFQILHDGYASVSDLYHLLEIPATSYSEEVGWNTDYPLRIDFSTMMSDDNRPCIVIDFDLHPRRKYAQLAR